MDVQSSYNTLSDKGLQALAALATPCRYHDGEVIFSEGDEANAMYIIESGLVVISIEKSGRQSAVAELGKGGLFGEMALLNQDTRSATATALGEVSLYSIEQAQFRRLLEGDHQLVEKLQALIQSRNDELLLKEQLIATTGVGQDRLHVSIKGDPSLRETAFTRERYESIADAVLPKLMPSLRKLLFDTSAYRVFVGLNNGEVRISSVINPFIEEVHNARKITSPAYIDRHFPPMEYETKVKFIYGLTEYIESTPDFAALPQAWNRVLDRIQDDWRPVPRAELEVVLDRLLELRKIPNFYLRNMSISVAQDAIRMQFNCDGTHIVSTGEYEHFLEQNIVFEE
jgi:CRP-like cAMP-binding protein